ALLQIVLEPVDTSHIDRQYGKTDQNRKHNGDEDHRDTALIIPEFAQKMKHRSAPNPAANISPWEDNRPHFSPRSSDRYSSVLPYIFGIPRYINLLSAFF
ncbi:hypothetical protein, partial [Mesorhizobium sp. P5_C1]